MKKLPPPPKNQFRLQSKYPLFVIAPYMAPKTPRIPKYELLQIRRCECLHHTGALAETRLEDAVRVLEHAVLETDDDELRALEARLDQAADVLRVRQIQRRVHLVEDVHGRRLELQQRHDERQRNQRSASMLVSL